MGLLENIFGGGGSKLVESVGGVLDNLTTNKEEKLEAKRKIKELVANYQIEVEKNIEWYGEERIKIFNFIILL